MTGNGRFESPSGSMDDAGFSGNYSNGQRGNYPGTILDRSGSFREGSESRMFGAGATTSRGSGGVVMAGDLPPISQCLMLEPIIMSDQKYTRSGELRRALGFSFASTSENSSFGGAHSKPTPPVAAEDIKRFKASVSDTCSKAKGRTKRLDESLHRLNKYCDVVTSKKQQRNELIGNERSGGSNMLKVGIHRNPPDLGTQRLEDRTKNVVTNKRVRSSVAETRGESRSNNLPRQSLVLGKDRDTLKDGGAGSDLAEEKIRRLSAGEGWEKKIKRKRSVGAVFTRPMDTDGELKRAMHHKLSNEAGPQSCEPHTQRTGSYNTDSCVNKLGASVISSSARASVKGELEKPCLQRDQTAGINKERIVAKANYKSNIREDNHIGISGPLTKGKPSRVLRVGPAMTANSSPNLSRSCGVVESWEQSPVINKVPPPIAGPTNRKRTLPAGSSSPPMAQWVGQRPQKISRTRRANLVSPVSNFDEMQMSSESCPTPDSGAKISSSGINGSLLTKNAGNGSQQIKVKLENVSSPARLSESEESEGNRPKEKGISSGVFEEKAGNVVQTIGSSVLPSKKNRTFIKEEVGDGVRRQGRSGRGSPFSRGGIPTVGEKLETSTTAKPLRTARPNIDKSGSKSGRPPLKKMSDRKVSSRGGLLPISGSPDLAGESDEDREELLAAAKFASRASYTACSGSFWKKMEPVFASVRMEDISYLKQQGESVHEELTASQTTSKESALYADTVGHPQNFNDLCVRMDSEIFDRVAPLYQRVLSALIVEDEDESLEDKRRSTSSYCARADSRGVGSVDLMEYEFDSSLASSDRKQLAVDRVLSNGGTGYNRGPTNFSSLCNGERSRGPDFAHIDVTILHGYQDRLNGQHVGRADANGILSFDLQYEEAPLDERILLELQSIGLYPETVPDLEEGDDEMINQDIVKLKKELFQEVARKKAHLDKLCKAVEEIKEVEERKLEQVAMDRLVELAYRKQLATRGSSASKSGTSKVPKQVAMAFVKRTLARCRRFEDAGNSCFSESALREAIFAPPPRHCDAELTNSAALTVATNFLSGPHKPQREARIPGSCLTGAERLDLHSDKTDRGLSDGREILTSSSDQAFARHGPMSNRGKKKELLLDDVGGASSFRATSVLGNTLSDGAKGRRSERDRDRDTLSRTSVGKSGRPSGGNLRGERKTKSKPKQQKTAQLSASGNGIGSRSLDVVHPVYPTNGVSSEVSNGSNRKREVGLTSAVNIPQDPSTGNTDPMDLSTLQLHEFDSIEEFGVDDDLGTNPDFGTWLDIGEDILQDFNSAGLDIPMDDISDLNMLL